MNSFQNELQEATKLQEFKSCGFISYLYVPITSSGSSAITEPDYENDGQDIVPTLRDKKKRVRHVKKLKN